MKNACCLLTLALTSTLTVVAVPSAFACSPPPEILVVEATAPRDGAENVPVPANIIIHLRAEQDWVSDGFPEDWNDPEGMFELVVLDASGVEALRTPVGPASPLVVAADLQPLTTYRAELQRGEVVFGWGFTTGGAATIPPGGPGLQIETSTHYTSRSVYSCCPEQFIGECPNCFVIGQEPRATISAHFETLGHADGPAGYSYTLQTRPDVDGADWVDVRSAAFNADGPQTLSRMDDRLRNATTCLRVVATDATDPAIVIESEPRCVAPEQFDAPPDYGEYDYSDVDCGDGLEEEVEEEEEEVVEDDLDTYMVDDAEEDDSARAGWEVSEGSGQLGDDGCGCSSNGTPPAGSLLMLAFGAFLLRRRTTRAT